MPLGKGIKVTWFGHSTFKLVSPGGKHVMLDPWVNNPVCPDALKAVDRCDVMAITHGHFDHLADAAAIAARTQPKAVIGIYELANWLGSRGVANTVGMNKGGSHTVEGLTFTMTVAFHSSSFIDDAGTITYLGEPGGYVITFENGARVYCSGDTCVFGDMRLIGELYRPDIAMLPIGDLYTMGPFEAAHAVRLLGVKHVIPMHWGTFPALTGTPQAVREALNDPSITVHELKPGDTIE